MTTTKRRSERQQWNPDLGVLAARLSDATQAELFERLAEQGHGDLRPRHGAVCSPTWTRTASAPPSWPGSRAATSRSSAGWSTSSRTSATSTGSADPADRRAKLIVPTERGLEAMRLADGIVAEIERRHAEAAGRKTYAEFRNVLRSIVE